MFINFGKFNLKKFLFLLVPVIKIIREAVNFSDAFYNVPNILIQYLFLCVAKFANVIFWFILNKKIKFPKKVYEKKFKNKDSKENINTDIDIKNSKNSEIGLSQKEINYNEKMKKKKRKFYLQIFYLIFSSLIDFISNFYYLQI